MSLFEKVKNIRRNNLQEKRKFPGDESGAYKRAKDDLEARKGFSKNKPGGLKADEKNPFVKRSVRKTRVDKLGGDIYDAPKFSQKKFDKSIGGAKKPTSPAAPGLFGKGDTKGQMNVKGMEKKAFKKTQPSDIKLPKSFTDFQRNLQDYKDRDQPGGPRKSSTKSKTSGTPLTRQDVGMAPPDKPKTKGVKQSEVSKKAKDFTKQINQNRTSSGIPMRKGATTIPKDTAKDIQISKMKDRIKELGDQRQKMRSTTGTKDVKGMRKVNREIRQYQKSIKSNPFAPTVYDKKNKSTASTSKPQKGYDLFKADPEADKFRRNIEKSKELKDLTKEMGKKNLIKSITPTGKTSKVVSKKNIALTGKLLKQKNYKYVQAGAKLGTKLGFGKGALVKVGKAVGRLGTGGRIVGGALAIAGAASRPGIRQGFKTFLKGAGLGGLVGAGAQLNKKKPVGDAVLGPKKIKTVSTSLEPPKPKETSYSKTMKSVKPYDFTKIKQDIADKKQKAKADRKADRLARENALSASEKQRQRRGIG